MTSIAPSILSKIKKCLALTSSNNPTEAATAMRQAKALMDKHGVARQEILMSDIGESTIESITLSRDKPAQWEAGLASLVGKAFGCRMMVERTVLPKGLGHANRGGYIFVGLKHQAEIAAYTATVLIRRCKSARRKWISENFDGRSKGYIGVKRKITRLGDAFAEGWVSSIAQLVTDFANLQEVDDAITTHVANRATGVAETRAIPADEIGRNEQIAAYAGQRVARDERLHRPMNSGQEQRLLSGAETEGHRQLEPKG